MYQRPFHSKDLSDFTFLVSGGAGFIGSNLVEYLLKNGAKKVRVIDNLSNGYQENVDLFSHLENYEFVLGDISDYETCEKACEGIDYLSHQAALGSVPRSLKDPVNTNQSNVVGFLNMITAARKAGVKRVVYASSSSVYGDSVELPKVEDNIGKPLSPYAVSKYTNELYAQVAHLNYQQEIIGLRYFNVFGPRQSPQGAYAAVIPLFIEALSTEASPYINGDGGQTRDFTFVENAVEANIKALFTEKKEALGTIFNVALGKRYTLNEVFEDIKDICQSSAQAEYREDREGDIRDSLADISKSKLLLDYDPQIHLRKGLESTIEWFLSDANKFRNT